MTSVSVSAAVASASDTNGINAQVLSEVVHITPIPGQDLLLADDTLNMTAPPTAGGEPPAKRQRTDDDSLDQNQAQSIKQILFNINKAICLRLDAIENKLETVSMRTKYLEEKVEQIGANMRLSAPTLLQTTSTPKPGLLQSGRRNNAVIVGIPSEKIQASTSQIHDSKEALVGLLGGDLGSSPRIYRESGDRSDQIHVLDCGQAGSLSPGSDSNIQNLGPNVTLITLNSEEDYPNGCWLGDENNPEMRVRIPLSPSDLLHIHSNCRTPEKMALAFLDYLFDRETQACSNLSGMGKHGKKQLDPLMIYGIRCHLIARFGIAEQDWHRIKQNIDSKCRTAFRRKIKGLPLAVKAFRGKAPPTYVHVQQSPGGTVHEIGGQSDDSMQEDNSELHIEETEVDMANALSATSAAEIIQNAGGQIQVLHATPEQVAQLQQTHSIQIVHGDQVMFNPGGEHHEGLQVAVSMAQRLPEGIQVVSENGETIQIAQAELADHEQIDDDTQDTEQ